jgi:hypothetical protein
MLSGATLCPGLQPVEDALGKDLTMNMIFVKDRCIDTVTYDSWCTTRVDINKHSIDVDVDVDIDIDIDMIGSAQADPHQPEKHY